MIRNALVAVALLLLSAVPLKEARASAFQTHTYQADLPLRLVERPLVLGKGWVQLSFGFDAKVSTSYFLAGDSVWNMGTTEGTNQSPYANNARWNYNQVHIRADWGFTKNSQLFLDIPFVISHLGNDIGADITSAGLGDVRLGIIQQWYRHIDQKGRFNTSLASTLEVKTPTGNESPGSYLSSPGNVTYLVLGTGTYDLALDLALKQQLGPLALKVRAGYTAKFSNVVEYLIEDEENQFNLRIDPGDEVNFDIGLLAQLGPYVGLELGMINTYRGRTRTGPSSEGIDPCSACDPIEGSNGIWTDGRIGLSVSPINRFQVDGFVEYTLAGRNSTFMFPLEDISPSRGMTAGGRISLRF